LEIIFFLEKIGEKKFDYNLILPSLISDSKIYSEVEMEGFG
jgi:hypothetical protein